MRPITLILLAILATELAGCDRPSGGTDRSKLQADAELLKRDFQDCVARGAFERFEEGDGVIRIRAELWDKLPYDKKKDIAAALYTYYVDRGEKYKETSIRSDRNDEVFASCSLRGLDIRR
jgi:hypothetical protein